MNTFLSDLFFNHRHDNRDRYLATIGPDEHDADAERAALMIDAQEFSEMVDGFTGMQWHTPAEYVADFYNRL